MKSKKVIVFCVIAGLLLLFFLYKTFLVNPVEIRRIPSSSATPVDKALLKKYNLKHYPVNDIHYFKNRDTTVRGGLFNLEKRIKKIEYNPELKGNYGFYVNIFAKPEEQSKLEYKLYHNGILLYEGKAFSNKTENIHELLNLSKKDTITLSAKGEGLLLVGDPVFYKMISPEDRNYVFLICADTLRADHLPVYGYERNTAPHIDSFASDSVVFKNAYAQAPWTLPSHMSLFTALYEFNHGVRRGTMLSSKVHYLIEELSQKFSTRSFNGGIYVGSNFGFFRGFDYYKSITQDQLLPNASKNLFSLAKQDLESNPFSNSFYFLHTYQTHSPYNPLMKYLKIFNESPEYTYLSAPTVGSNHRDQYIKLPESKIKAYIDLYDAEIYTFDVWFGEFISYLKKKNIYDQSMIIFMSDHGEEFFDHSGWGHTHSLYNELIRVPLIIKFPEGKYKGQRVETEVGLIDIMPMILNYYHIPFNKKKIDGTDLMSFVRGKVTNRTLISSLTSGYYIPQLPFKTSIINQGKKVIYNMPYTEKTFSFFNTPPPPYKEYEYYNLWNDPEELINIFNEKIKQIKEYKSLFDRIILKGKKNLKTKAEATEFDEKDVNVLKSLGYLK